MLAPELADAIETAIRSAESGNFTIRSIRPVGGGCIGTNYGIADGATRYFLKTANAPLSLFHAEADGLAALSRCTALVVPRAVATGSAGAASFLVLGWLDLHANGDEARLGEAIAALHSIDFPEFGWHTDNFIGLTPQDNTPHRDWPTFYRERRLLPQLRMAANNGAPELIERAAPLLAALPALFAGHRPAASLLHGDLWAGNKAYAAGRPCLFDPSIHAGDGETDLAMSELFGGFSPRFFAAYRAVRPLGDGYRARRPVYQLYHVLNHYKLFGGSYAQQAEWLMETALAGM